MILSIQYQLNSLMALMITELQNKLPALFNFLGKVFSRENLLAVIIALILIAIFITTAADAPTWLYQGF